MNNESPLKNQIVLNKKLSAEIKYFYPPGYWALNPRAN